MRTPEEFAAQMGSALWNGDDAADLIRARDAEVRAEVDRIALTLSTMTTHGGADAKRIAETAAALVGLEWETRSRDDGYAGWASGQGLIAKTSTRERRLVGPWEPAP